MPLIGEQARLARIGSGSPLCDLAEQIHSVRIVEAVSEPYEIVVEVGSNQPARNIGTIIGSEAVVEIGGYRWGGFVRSVFYLSGALTDADNEHRYRVVLVPRLWYLSQSAGYRIFENQKAKDIIGQLLGEHGARSDRLDPMPVDGERAYIVQYGETDLEFLQRLVAEAGGSFHFQHGDAGTELNIVQMPYGEPVAINESSVSNLSIELSAQVSKVTVIDYDDNDARPVSEANNTQGPFRHSGSQITRYAEGRLDRAADLKLAPVDIRGRAQVLAQTTESYDGASRCQFDLNGYEYGSDRIYPGCELTGIGAISAMTAKKLVVVRTEFVFSEGYGNTSSLRIHCALVEDRLHMPLPAPRRPVGPMVATVSGVKASDSNGSRDPHREVQVTFPWETKCSCWLRVAQAYAGRNWGASFVPRVGQDVLVDFINGNLERPVVVGALYNGKNPGPDYTATQSGYRTESNELRFDDKKGEELVHIEAGRDLGCAVTNELEIEAGKSVLLKTGGCSITMDQNNIVLKTRHNTISLGPSGITVKGTGVKVNSETTAEIKAGISITVEGAAKAELKSSGVTTVKGAMTMIN